MRSIDKYNTNHPNRKFVKIPVFILSLITPFFLQGQRLGDIPKAVLEISDQSQIINFSTKGFNIPHKGGHYQGIQVYQTQRGSRNIIISGSSAKRAYYLAIEQSEKAKVRELFTLDQEPYRHAGGIQIYEHYLAVGVEDNAKRTTSKVQIYDLQSSAPQARKLIEIPRDGAYEVSTAGAVALTKVDKDYLLIVGSWDCQSLDFYQSNAKALNDPNTRFTLISSWKRDKAKRNNWSDQDFASYQNLNLLTDKQGKVYMLGFAQVGKKEVIDVFEIKMGANILPNQRLQKVMRKEILLRKTTFKAGGGLFINDDGKLSIYACHHHEGVVEIVDSP